MSSIETIAKPYRNRISVAIPKEYSSYSFQVILIPIESDSAYSVPAKIQRAPSFVDALLSCPKLLAGESLDVSRDSSDCGRDIDV